MKKGYRTEGDGETGSKDKKGAGGPAGPNENRPTSKSVGPRNGVRLKVPERGVRLVESEPDVPSFVVAPDDLRFSGAAGLGMNEPYALMEWKRSANDGHAARVRDVHSDAVRTLALGAFFPFHLKTDLRNNALVGAHFCPAIFDIVLDRTGDCVGYHEYLAAKEVYREG